MRWALINYEFPPLGGGAGTATKALARELAQLGHEVTVITAGFGGLPARQELDGYLVLRLPARREKVSSSNPWEMLSFMFSGLRRVVGAVREARPDVSLAFFGLPSGPVAWWLLSRLGTPYLVMLRGGDIPGFCPEQLTGYHRLTKPLLRMIWQRASLVVANSFGARDLARATGWEIPVEVLPNGVDTTFFHPPDQPRPHGTVNLLFVGRLSVQKGVENLLNSLVQPELQSLPVDWHLTIVGEGPLGVRLRQHVQRLTLQDRVEFLGWLNRSQVAACYRAADIFVLPSLDEGMPNVLLEAMASGLPCLVTDVPGSRELVSDGLEGLVVPAHSPVFLAARLADLIGDPKARQEMGQQARTAALQRSWGAVANSLESMVSKIVTKPRGSSKT